MSVGAVGKGKYMSGTSFAAPFVAAAIAQKLAASQKMDDAAQRLEGSIDPIYYPV